MNPLTHKTAVRPPAAGAPIWCPTPGANYVGTLGLVLERPGLGWFGLTCRHVLLPPGTSAYDLVGVPVYQPAVDDPANVIGFLDPNHVAATLDVAAFRFLPGVVPTLDIDQLGPMGPPASAHANQRVMKLGYVTGSTDGDVVDTSAAPMVLIAPADPFHFARTGDSGAVWFDPMTLSPVAVHTGVRYSPILGSSAVDIQAAIQACGL